MFWLLVCIFFIWASVDQGYVKLSTYLIIGGVIVLCAIVYGIHEHFASKKRAEESRERAKIAREEKRKREEAQKARETQELSRLKANASRGGFDDILALAEWFEKHKQPQEALRYYLKIAPSANSEVHRKIARLYWNKDWNQTFQWMRKSAEEGNVDAQKDLGFLYEMGEGTPINYEKAIYWYKQAADNGDIGVNGGVSATAKAAIGAVYAYKLNDYSKGFPWFLQAAKEGNDFAQEAVWGCYVYGRGVRQNRSEAEKWKRKLLASGNHFPDEFVIYD